LHKWSAEISAEVAELIASVDFEVAWTMKREKCQQAGDSVSADDRPRGTADWISSDLIADTIATWQPYYAEPLTIDEVIAMIEGVGRLMEPLPRDSVP